jgi:hypothetical protein
MRFEKPSARRTQGPFFGYLAARAVTARLDRQQAARFLSYSGNILEFWRGNLAA